MKSWTINRRLLAGIACMLTVICFVAVNIWADKAIRDMRVDLTEDGIYTIADGTRAVIAAIREPVTLRYYASSEIDILGPSYAELKKRVDELLEVYRRLSGGLIRIERYDPKAFSPEEDMAVADGVQALPVGNARNDLFLGIAGTNSTDGHYAVPHLTPERRTFLEYELTRLIHDLANPQKGVVALIGDLPLNGDPEARAEPWAVTESVERFFDVRSLHGAVSKIDDDVDILWLAEPAALPEVTLYAIDQFVMRGGRVLAFVDPLSEVMRPAQRPGQPPSEPRQSSLEALEPLLASWGVEIPADHVVGDRSGALRVQVRKGRRITITDYLAWFQTRRANFAADDLVTGALNLIQFRSVGEIKLREGASTILEPLVSSSTKAGTVEVARIENGPDPTAILANFKTSGTPYTLAARVRGSVKSAFPDGPPEALEDAEIRAAHKADSDTPLALILIADTDMLADGAWVRSRNLLGNIIRTPFANNGDFVVNALDQLSGSESVIGLRGRGVSDRRFIVIEEMERQAEQRYRASEQDLRGKLRGLEKKIADLQRTEREQGVILSDEQQGEIDDARGDMLDLRRELRDVRYAIRKDVVDLKANLTFVNIWIIPILLTLFVPGFAFWRARRTRLSRRVEG